MKYDVAIVGLGAMGSASAYFLARSGARVVAFDQFTPPHTHGSSHGHSRIIREAYYEHPLYVPLVQRAYELWNALQADAPTRLLVQTGGITAGRENGALVTGALASVRTHHIPHEILDARAAADRFPAYRFQDGWIGVYENRAGMLDPEACVDACLNLARRSGATIRLNERVTGWSIANGAVAVQTAVGRYEADRIVVAAGPWLPSLTGVIGEPLPLVVERQLSHWFEPHAPNNRYSAGRCPVGLWELGDGDLFATLPDSGHGVKCGTHHAGADTTPDTVDRAVSPADVAHARALLEDVMPGAGARALASRVCLYTNTPDRHFIIDWAQGGRVLIASPCSGHGFKFASAIGEVVAQLVTQERAWVDLTPFALRRFKRQ